MTVQQQRSTDNHGLPELPSVAAETVCPWCCGPVEELHRSDRGLLGYRFVDVTFVCRDCDVVIRLSWPSAPHTQRPHG